MNPSEVERRLRREADAFQPRAPDTPRQQALRALRRDARSPARSTWLWAGAAAATLAGVLLWQPVTMAPVEPPGDGPMLADLAGPALMDRAVVGREAALRQELEHVQNDLARIRGWISSDESSATVL